MSEIWVDSERGDDVKGSGNEVFPYKTIGKGVGMLSGGLDLLRLRGTFVEGLGLSEMKFEKRLVVDGGDETLLFGFEGKKEGFNPLSMPPRTWGGITVMDCHNVTIKNLAVWGGMMQAVNLNDSYPDIGLKNILLDNLKVRYGAKRGIFMGGSNIECITIKDCLVSETIYGDTTHGIYLSGGHWSGSYPPVRNVAINGTVVHHSGGRHGIQFNGRFSGVLVKGCELRFNELAGLSLIGVRNATVENCRIFANNRQGIVLYDYFDGKYYDPEHIEEWKSCHHGMANIAIMNNTVLVGPKQWKKDDWHNNTPKNKAAILVNSNMGAIVPEYKPENIMVKNNVLWSKDDKMVEFVHKYDATATQVHENMMWASGQMPKVYAVGDVFEVPWLEKNTPDYYKDNLIENPKFDQVPEYDFIDLTQGPFDFSMHSYKASLYSEIAKRKGMGYRSGKGTPVRVFGREDSYEQGTNIKLHPWS